MVERMHATMGHAITTLTQGRPDRWDDICNRRYLHCESASMQSPSNHPSICFMVYTLDYQVMMDPSKETMAPLDDVELMEERAELTAREFDELGQHRTAAYQVCCAS
ncbi:hypothetical protein BASA83_003913 [Batrachochytrium salamandrivorans]|nr:hypothetical protein BASA83_003913 [Batrachochytrium salamandrivorans]